MKVTRYRFATAVGMFSIELRQAGLWRVLFGRREVYVASSPESALAGLLREEAAWPGGPSNSSLGLPTDLRDWAPSRQKPK